MAEAVDAYPEWRYGQAAFNVLYRVRPELADSIRGTELDPFYSQKRVDAFFTFVARNWS